MSERPGGRESEPGPSGRGSGRPHVDSPSGPAEGHERGTTSVVLDASALLAFLQDEDGADVVESALADHAQCGAANWSEVAQKVIAADRDWALVRALLISYEVRVDPVSIDDGEWAARRWKRCEGLSLADRLCLALAERVDTDVLTADTTWGSGGRVRQIR